MKNKLICCSVIVGGVSAVLLAYASRRSLITQEIPTHDPYPNCTWSKRVFPKSGVTAFVQDCPTSPWGEVVAEDQDGAITETARTADPTRTYKFTIRTLTKDKDSRPYAVVKEWYSKLTPEEQKVCDIQNPDSSEPVSYFPDGRQSWVEEPRPTSHKIRFKIDVKREILQEWLDKYGSYPYGPEYDFMCGHTVGSMFGAYPPYFEFDDRSPGEYLLVGSYGQGGQPDIDLNPISF